MHFSVTGHYPVGESLPGKAFYNWHFQAFYAFDHFSHEYGDECGCDAKALRAEEEAKLVMEQERMEQQRLVSRVKTDHS